mmetsp:Transcript_37009/g.37664  ORF Transcript_37009/g.37664 Transcript_37009/m.37664 type:complete len:272 (+) Transcript_37009:22-837(+)
MEVKGYNYRGKESRYNYFDMGNCDSRSQGEILKRHVHPRDPVERVNRVRERDQDMKLVDGADGKRQKIVDDASARAPVQKTECNIPSCLLGEAPVIVKKQAGFKIESDKEFDDHKIQTRMKQISYGKNTMGYDNYIAQVPKHMRKGYLEHPRTPDPYEKQSKRTFDGRIRAWRRGLHKFDPNHSDSISTSPSASIDVDALRGRDVGEAEVKLDGTPKKIDSSVNAEYLGYVLDKTNSSVKKEKSITDYTDKDSQIIDGSGLLFNDSDDDVL